MSQSFDFEINIELPEELLDDVDGVEFLSAEEAIEELSDEEIMLYNSDYEETWLDDAVLVKREMFHSFENGEFVGRMVWVTLYDNLLTRNRTIFNDILAVDSPRLQAGLETRGIV